MTLNDSYKINNSNNSEAIIQETYLNTPYKNKNILLNSPIDYSRFFPEPIISEAKEEETDEISSPTVTFHRSKPSSQSFKASNLEQSRNTPRVIVRRGSRKFSSFSYQNRADSHYKFPIIDDNNNNTQFDSTLVKSPLKHQITKGYQRSPILYPDGMSNDKNLSDSSRLSMVFGMVDDLQNMDLNCSPNIHQNRDSLNSFIINSESFKHSNNHPLDSCDTSLISELTTRSQQHVNKSRSELSLVSCVSSSTSNKTTDFLRDGKKMNFKNNLIKLNSQTPQLVGVRKNPVTPFFRKSSFRELNNSQYSNSSQKSDQESLYRIKKNNFLKTGLIRGLHPNKNDILYDMSGTFSTLKSPCKILMNNSQICKKSSWKWFYMCVSPTHVRFIRDSLAYCGTTTDRGRSTTTCKTYMDSQTAQRNNHLAQASMIYNNNQSVENSLLFATTDSTSKIRQKKTKPCQRISCVEVPIHGLIWQAETVLPSDLPSKFSFQSIIPVNHHNASAKTGTGHSSDQKYDPMDTISYAKPTACETSSSGNQQQQQMRCIRFLHPNYGVDLLFIFADQQAANVALNMCQKFGGNEYKENSDPRNIFTDLQMSTDQQSTSSLPKAVSKIATKNANLYRNSQAFSENLISGTISSSSSYLVHSRKSNSVDDASPISSQTSPVSYCSSSKNNATLSRLRIRYDSGSASGNPNCYYGPQFGYSIDDPTSLSRSSKFHNESTPLVTKGAKIGKNVLKGLANWLCKPLNNSTNLGNDQTLFDHGDEHFRHDIVDPQIVTALRNNSSTFLRKLFQSPLESHIFLTENPFVPAILHILVTALESHGLNQVGFYRRPGRQKTINDFILISNLTGYHGILESLDGDLYWNEVNILADLIKGFIRRLPSSLLDFVQWESLLSLVPDDIKAITLDERAVILSKIRQILLYMAIEAYNSMKLSHFEMSPNQNFIQCDQNTQISLLSAWTWSTFVYIIRHLLRVIKNRHSNLLLYSCLAICFGPVLFSNAPSNFLNRVNSTLELLLVHWDWLITDLTTLVDTLDDSIALRLGREEADEAISEFNFEGALKYLQSKSTETSISEGDCEAMLTSREEEKVLLPESPILDDRMTIVTQSVRGILERICIKPDCQNSKESSNSSPSDKIPRSARIKRRESYLRRKTISGTPIRQIKKTTLQQTQGTSSSTKAPKSDLFTSTSLTNSPIILSRDISTERAARKKTPNSNLRLMQNQHPPLRRNNAKYFDEFD